MSTVSSDSIRDPQMMKVENKKEGGDDNDDTETIRFLRLVYAGNVLEVEKMLINGMSVHASNASGLQAIHFASKKGDLEMMEMLMRRGASINARSRKGNTALHTACLSGNAEVVKMLLKNGADLNVTCECNEDHFTPLYMAAQGGHQEIVTLLLAHGADPLIKTSNGFLAEDVALQIGHTTIAELLAVFARQKQLQQLKLLPEKQQQQQSTSQLPTQLPHHQQPFQPPIQRRSRKHSLQIYPQTITYQPHPQVHPFLQLPRKQQSEIQQLNGRLTRVRNSKSAEKLLLREVMGAGSRKRAPAITRRDLFPSPHNSPMRNNFDSRESSS